MAKQEIVINLLQEAVLGIIAGVKYHFMHVAYIKHIGFITLGNRPYATRKFKRNGRGTVFINRITELVVRKIN